MRLTRERPAPGLVVYQPAKGFRYAMDPFLLCAWALEGGRPARVVDLGTGSGIMALLMARQGITAVGYDLLPEWIELASRSALESGLAARFERQDIRALPPAEVELALLNPPYLPAGSGAVSPDPWKAAARTELNGCLEELVSAAARHSLRLCVVIRADRAPEVSDAMDRAGLFRARRCDIDQSLVLLEGCRSPATASVERVAMRAADGGWSVRVRGWYASLGARLT